MIRQFIIRAVAKARYLGLASAIVVLSSWVVTNTVSTRLASARSTLDRAIADDDLIQRLTSLRREYREINATLSRLDLLLSEMRPNSVFSAFPDTVGTENRTTYALVQSARVYFSSHEDLQDLVLAVRRITLATDLSPILSRDIDQELRRAEELLQGYLRATSIWDEKRRKSIELVRAGKKDSRLFDEATTDYIKAAGQLQERFLVQRDQLLKMHGRILAELSSRFNRLKMVYRVSERISWFLYVAGASLAIFGKWLEARNDKS